VRGHLIDPSGAADVDIDLDALESWRRREGFWWLDLHGPSDEEFERFGRALGFHPLAIEDAVNFGQRPKLEEYDDFVFLVVYGAAPDEDDVVEVHCFYTERFLVTVRRDDCPAFAEARERHERRPETLGEPALVLHRVVDALGDSFFPLLTDIDEFVDVIEEAIFTRPDQEQLRRVFLMKRRLVNLRRVVAPQRDLLATIASGVAEVPALTREAERRFRDAYDHMIRLTDTIDSYRDLLTGASDAYLSTVSNRVGDVTKQLAVIATIFLPLTFVTGFFGQNFAWLIRAVGGEAAFWTLGVVLQFVTLAGLLLLFRRRGWF
jgi:magnesium transporter